jgi:hypothetical protein
MALRKNASFYQDEDYPTLPLIKSFFNFVLINVAVAIILFHEGGEPK